ncbi:MAG: hypothetical protein LBC30_03675 [Puniceicoccales bacterium]|jgi:hypothetical protein|nr:hypothetical protein [Puniceicoccales bacterium]
MNSDGNNVTCTHSAVPNYEHVKKLRDDGFEICVFRGKEGLGARRVVVISSLYESPNGKGTYYVYDSKLEDEGQIPIITLTKRDVETLKHDPTLVKGRL